MSRLVCVSVSAYCIVRCGISVVDFPHLLMNVCGQADHVKMINVGCVKQSSQFIKVRLLCSRAWSSCSFLFVCFCTVSGELIV